MKHQYKNILNHLKTNFHCKLFTKQSFQITYVHITETSLYNHSVVQRNLLINRQYSIEIIFISPSELLKSPAV